MNLKFTLSKMRRTQSRLQRLVETTFQLPQKTGSRQRRRVAAPRSDLMVVENFGSNPGRLTMKLVVPRRIAAKPALVVVLHGCRQTPESLDGASGFSRHAAHRGFVLLYPQQRDFNNSQRCFNWFRPSAVARDRGEVLSIHQMVEHTCRSYGVDRSRVYLAGLSAGGALAVAVLAAYPKLFAGVAVFAGMPNGSARDALSAMHEMKRASTRSPDEWGDFVRTVSPSKKAWPPLSIWQGTSDTVVDPRNADAGVSQWLNVLKIAPESGRRQEKEWGTLIRWNGSSKSQLSYYLLEGFGHGLPVRVGQTKRNAADPFVLKAGISGPNELMRIWGLKRFAG